MRLTTMTVEDAPFWSWYYAENQTGLKFLKLNRIKNDISGLPIVRKDKCICLMHVYTKYCERKG